MVKGIINAYDHMEFCLVINLIMGSNQAVTWPSIVAIRYVSFATTLRKSWFLPLEAVSKCQLLFYSTAQLNSTNQLAASCHVNCLQNEMDSHWCAWNATVDIHEKCMHIRWNWHTSKILENKFEVYRNGLNNSLWTQWIFCWIYENLV